MSTVKPNDKMELKNPKYQLAQSHGLSQRSKWLRDYYFMVLDREWNNEYTSFTTGIPGDRLWAESDYYIVPETYFYMRTNDWGIFSRSLNLMAHFQVLKKLEALSMGLLKLTKFIIQCHR